MDIVLHLGAHKTASTYLQTMLEKNLVPLERHRVGFANPKTLRPMFAIAPRRAFKTPRASRNDARAWTIRQVLDTAVDLQRERQIISEEQLIGSLRQLFSGKGLYTGVAQELSGVTTALQGRPVTVMMALRSYDTFLISAYGQVLSGWKYIRFTSDLRKYLLAERRGWPEILTEIMQALPRGSDLKLWQYETFSAQERNILRTMVGDDTIDSLKPLDATPGLGPSTEGIKALDQLADAGMQPDIETIRRTLRQHGKDKGFAGYDPWTHEERAALQEKYARDLDLIRGLWPEAFIDGTEPFCASLNGDILGDSRVGHRPAYPMTNLQKRIAYRRPVTDTH